jgi:hypothetical protein
VAVAVVAAGQVAMETVATALASPTR